MLKNLSAQLEKIHEMNLPAFVNLQKTVSNMYKMLYVHDSEHAVMEVDYADYDCFQIAPDASTAFIDYLHLDWRKSPAYHFLLVHTTREYALALSVGLDGAIVEKQHVYGQSNVEDLIQTFLSHFILWNEPVWNVGRYTAVNTTANTMEGMLS